VLICLLVDSNSSHKTDSHLTLLSGTSGKQPDCDSTKLHGKEPSLPQEPSLLTVKDSSMDKSLPNRGSKPLIASKSTGYLSEDACLTAVLTHCHRLLDVLMDTEKDSPIKPNILALLLAAPSGINLESLERLLLAKDKLVTTSLTNKLDALWKMLVLPDGTYVHLNLKSTMPSKLTLDHVLMLDLVSTPLKYLDLAVVFALLTGELTLSVMELTASEDASLTL
jgi:hypothetical protein